MKRSKKFIFSIITIFMLVLLSFIFVLIYNEIIKPFESNKYCDGEMLKEDEIMECDFFHKYCDKYNDYDVHIFTRNGKNCILPQITILFNHYVMESYAVFIYLNDDYYSLNNENLDEIEFIKTPIGYEEKIYAESINVNDWIVREIKYGYEHYESEYMINFYLNDIRKISYWYGYNDKKKQICFFLIEHDFSLDYYASIEHLTKYLTVNLPLN